MPPAKTPDNLMLIVGQLLEATKAASEGLKSMSLEVQSNAKVIVAASKTIELVEDKVSEIDRIIRDSTNAGNLVAISQTHTAELAGLHLAVKELKVVVEILRTEINKLGLVDISQANDKDAVWAVIKFIGFAITTAIAVYAAFSGK